MEQSKVEIHTVPELIHLELDIRSNLLDQVDFIWEIRQLLQTILFVVPVIREAGKQLSRETICEKLYDDKHKLIDNNCSLEEIVQHLKCITQKTEIKNK